MSRLRGRRTVTAAVVVTVETYLFVRYLQAGALFHFWLHLLLGGYVGLSVLAVLRLRRSRAGRSWRPWEAGFVGHLYSALPDVLFLAAGVLHVLWMDVFALHITVHFLWPNALVAGLALWTLAVVAYTAAALGRAPVAAAALTLSVLVLGTGLVLRAPLPSTLEQVRQQQAGGSLQSLLSAGGWMCSAAEPVDAVRAAQRAHHRPP